MDSDRQGNEREPHDGANGADAAPEPGVARVVEQSRRVRNDLEGLVSAVAEARGAWQGELRERLNERPYLGLAAAAGLGYVLGAGASPYLLRLAVGLGSRVAFAMVMRRLAETLGSTASARA